jgi:hypothetical protein
MVLSRFLILHFESHLPSRIDSDRSPPHAEMGGTEYSMQSDRLENMIQPINQFQKCT